MHKTIGLLLANLACLVPPVMVLFERRARLKKALLLVLEPLCCFAMLIVCDVLNSGRLVVGHQAILKAHDYTLDGWLLKVDGAHSLHSRARDLNVRDESELAGDRRTHRMVCVARIIVRSVHQNTTATVRQGT